MLQVTNCFCSLWENQKGFYDYSPIEKKSVQNFCFLNFFFWREGGKGYRSRLSNGDHFGDTLNESMSHAIRHQRVHLYVKQCCAAHDHSGYSPIMLLCVRCHSSETTKCAVPKCERWIHRLNINFFSFFMDDIEANNVATAVFVVDVRDHFAFASAILAQPFVQRTTDGHRSMVCKSVLANN